MRVLSPVSDAAMRLTTPRDVDGWVHLVGGYGNVVRGRYVTLFEMSPAQLQDGFEWAETLGYPEVTRRQLAWVARRQAAAHRRAHACCMASRWAADSLVREHGIDARRVHVVGYGRNADIPPPAERDWSSPRFLYIGRNWGRKNGAAVVRAFSRVRREVGDARLDIVGEHPPLDVEGVTGHGPRHVLHPLTDFGVDLINRATCFVVPSRLEPFGIVYQEAAAAGLPSIAGTIGGTADSVGPGGILVDPYDDDAIYQAMRSLCDPDTARSLGAVALQRSTAFTWSATVQRIVRALDLGPIPGVELAEFL
jgi:glycogen synthase